jgi:cyclopropane-fatty-acyl-phospholipid synthase
MLFQLFMRRLIRHGALTVALPGGKSFHVGNGAEDGPAPLRLVIDDPKVLRRLPWRPALAFGEGYMDGSVRIENGSLRDFLALFMKNVADARDHPFSHAKSAADRLIRRLHQNNPIPRAAKNVAHHYDLSPRLYELFLDADRQYSCAYFPTGAETLEQAQAAKKRHIAAKLLLRPGMSVLDIGCGWGGTALSLAKDFDVSVTGITLSERQLEVARARAQAAGLADRVRFDLMDYREVEGRFDRIVSVGMFEHVGVRFYRAFFRAVRERLAPDGVALLHTIGRSGPPGDTNPWLRKYIFPGGYCPALSEIMAAVERERLITADVEVLRLHYAETLRLWHDRFRANRAEIAAMLDERFCRMWEFYLVGSEMAFRHESQVVFQIQLTRDKTAVPETRDYIAAFEAAHPL